MKTVRFKEVVKTSGVPTIFLLWGPPENDPAFASALKGSRIMTVHQELHGGKKDFGTVGFVPERRSQILLFPKSLRPFAQAHVVAIDYDLLAKDSPTHSDAPERKPVLAPSKKNPKPAPAAKSTPPQKTSVQLLPFPSSKTPEPPRAKTQRHVIRDTPSQPPAKLAPHGVEVPPTVTRPALPEAVAAEIKKALRELKAGKAVAAYERLSEMLGAPASRR